MNGHMFVFKHPAGAASWSMREMLQMKLFKGMHVVKVDFCMVGMRAEDKDGATAPARKRTMSPIGWKLLRCFETRSTGRSAGTLPSWTKDLGRVSSI